MTDPTAAYGFLPWLRTGLATDITDPGTAPRATVEVTITVDAAGDARPVPVTLPLLGPGDIAAVDPRVVIRAAPRPNELSAEPNELPLIEFVEPDLPWRYTPSAPDAQGRLRPWLVLAILRDDEITDRQPAGSDGRLPAITVASADALPRLDQSWAWAHVQVDGFQPATEALDSVDPRRIRARILAPRHLVPRTSYTAALVPAFERGRLAGLREPVLDSVAALTDAWAPGAHGVRLPVYLQWTFTTGEQADFEQLARRLTGRPAPASVGTYAMDVATPDPALPAAASAPLTFTGALYSPAATVAPWPASERDTFVAALAGLLNRPADALASGGEPIVAPPLWGRWHAAVDRLAAGPTTAPEWFHEVNGDPRLRATAGLGAEVIRRHDDALMAEAWDQVGAVIAANEVMRRAQVAREASRKLLDNHLSALDADTLLQVTAPVHSRVVLSGEAVTVSGRLATSPIPAGATDGRMRRARRSTDRRIALAARRSATAQPAATALAAGPAAASSAGLLARLNSGDLAARPPMVTPAGMVTVTLAVSGPGGHGTIFGGVHVGAETAIAAAAGVGSASVPVAAAGPATPLEPAVGRASVIAHGAAAVPGSAQAAPVSGPGGPGSGQGPGSVQPGPVPSPAVGWLPGVAGGVLGSTTARNTPIPISTDPRDDAAIERTAALFGQAMVQFVGDAQALPAAGPMLHPANLDAVGATLRAALDPRVTIPAALRARLRLAPWVTSVSPDPLEPVMAAPEFDTPMYEPLRDLGQDWMLPGAGAILADTVTVVLPNERFIEAYMLGLSFEMGRELLFHEYPTDQRGTYFAQFWDARDALTPEGIAADPATLRDIAPITQWHPDQLLGGNTARQPAPPPGGQLVLLVKGELFRRFPNTLVMAMDAVVGPDGLRTLGDQTIYPVFSGRLDPDIAFFGFNLSESVAYGTGVGTDLGWFFVLAEHPTEPRFGLDADDGGYGAKASAWPDLNWADLATSADALAGIDYIDLADPSPDVTAVVPAPGDPAVSWHIDGAPAGANGSDLAWITMRRPFRVAIHADDILPKVSPKVTP